MEKALVSVNAIGDKLLLGNDFIILKDETKGVYSFSSLVDAVKLFGTEKFTAFINPDSFSVKVFKDNDLQNINYRTHPFANIQLLSNPLIKVLNEMNGKTIPVEEFVLFIDRFKKYLSQSSLKLSDGLNDLKIRKILSIDRQNDKRGNYVFSIRAEKHTSDYEFPEKIIFEFPLIEGLQEVFTTEFCLYFYWKLNEGGSVDLKLMIDNIEFRDESKKFFEAIAKKYLETKNVKVLLGSIAINQATDEWKYKRNELNGNL